MTEEGHAAAPTFTLLSSCPYNGANFVAELSPLPNPGEVRYLAILPLRFLPDPVLRQKAKRVRKIDAALLRLVDDMIETMHAEQGVGLAATQVGVLQRVAVIQLPEDEEARVLINPEITRSEGEREIEEGCLSIPGYRGLLTRSVTVRAKALDRDGNTIRIKAEELLAQALQHEINHLNGILYIDHITSTENLRKVEPEEASPESETQDQPAGAATG